MDKTGAERCNKLKKGFIYYDALDGVLETRDSKNVRNMQLQSSNIKRTKTTSLKINDDSELDSGTSTQISDDEDLDEFLHRRVLYPASEMVKVNSRHLLQAPRRIRPFSRPQTTKILAWALVRTQL